MAIVGAIKKNGKGKKRILFALGFLVVMIIGSAISPDTESKPASTTPKAEDHKDSSKLTDVEKAKKKEEDKKKAEDQAKKDAEAAKKKAEEEAAAKKKAEEDAKKIKPGMYEVGKDIKPGLYKSYGIITYWARLKGLSGELDDVLANGNPQGSDIVEIKSTDKAFETQGVGYWLPIDNTYKPEMLSSFGDGMYIVGKDIAPGKYKSEGGDMGYWARLSGFSGDLSNVLANANPQGPAIVEIKATDKGFQTFGNGTWTKVQ